MASKKPESDLGKPDDKSGASEGDSCDSPKAMKDDKLETSLKTILPDDFRQIRTKQDLCKWIQQSQNYNDFIETFNYSAQGGDTIRKEKYHPTIYGLVVNDNILAGKHWRFAKVGFTQIDTTRGSNNRMEIVMKQIQQKGYLSPSVAFKLTISATDTTSFFETEERTRINFGFLVDKDLVKKLKLPCKTEWVLNSSVYFKKYKDVEAGLKVTKSTSIFKDCNLQFVKNMINLHKKSGTRENFEDWLKKENNFPRWLGLRQKNKIYEVFIQHQLPEELENFLKNH
ncbi:hypothetical protein CHS0354_023018 [Potamilus streckersoni]|uniref:Uncharacterized protein n=1 Tax=Potamilus streckersoni TaxID=2493646 RepID=A0AAE0SVI3_9BIVA|nr:hypothetical protein CHS0354_023018 [Potamilus streckersoni]